MVFRLARIKASLKKGRAKWEFSYAIENMPIKESGRPYYPLLLLIADTLSGLILDNQMMTPHSYQSRLTEHFLQAVEKAGMYPQEVLVEKDEAMHLLQPVASRLEIKLIKVRKCKESAKAREVFREHLSHRNSGTHRVTHLKDTVKGKSRLMTRNGTFLAEPCRYLHLHHCRSFIRFRCQSSLHQSPIRI